MAPPSYETISKDDLFAALSSMGVKLPKSSKLSTEDLTKKLVSSLNASQQLAELFPVKNGEHVNPTSMKTWKDTENLMKMTHRGSFKEGFDNMMSAGVKQDPSKAKEETFKEMQQILLSFGREWNNGHKAFILMDSEEEWAVIIQMLHVYAIDEKTPLYSLSFRVVSAIPNKPLKHQLEDILVSSDSGVQFAVSVRTTELERKVMLKLLHSNAKKLDPDFKPPGMAAKYTKKQWKLSFVLPLGPITMAELGKLTDLSGCEVCGSTKGTSRCSSCLSVLYCGTKCQSADWPRHKATCRSLKGGTWTTITFGRASFAPAGVDTKVAMFSSLVNWNESLQGRNKEPNKVSLEDVPPNVHGDKVFLAKFQISLFAHGNNTHFLIYDRQRSFQIFWKAPEDEEAFAVAQRALGDELKMYRFVKRTGERTMSVCFDRPPAQNPPW
ncbi:hypothetical protein FA15DRAFT_674468 [Coprinopsis marcescibilis]|uniref:MYND-type domain-containing protein n=1 Tax=Coprinopsis marcescibilis TaxID=230819 RepID=A0A5C3KHS7_COPMA|nr:hypothetical protein FA15DRAFT_674468 [Coprinopsis marcescibilis]